MSSRRQKPKTSVEGIYMNSKLLEVTAATLVLMFFSSVSAADDGKTAADLIAKAHKHDNMYTLGPQASRQKALEYYRPALETHPDDKQRLHILYRMAQLHGSAYQLEKGEKPNFAEAINLYKKIIDSYPPDEPLVFKAMISIGDHYVSLWQFPHAIEWFKRPLSYDLSQMENALRDLKESGRTKEAASLEDTMNKIRRYQDIALDQVVYAATRIHSDLRNPFLTQIGGEHPGTQIAERAQQLMVEGLPEIIEPALIDIDKCLYQENITDASRGELLADTKTANLLDNATPANRGRGPPWYHAISWLSVIGIVTLIITALGLILKRTFFLRS